MGMRMSSEERDAFTAWATGRRLSLLRTAVLLTGDHGRAEDLVQEALTKVAQRWGRLADGHPEAYARQFIVRDNVSRWRRSRLEVVSSPAADDRRTPSPDADTDRRLVLLAALGRLTERRGPTVEQQGRLAVLPDSPLPAEIDLGAPVERTVDSVVPSSSPMPNAATARAIGPSPVLAEDGTWREVDVSRLEPVAHEQGNAFVPLGDASLSPDGTRLVFAQPDRLEIYDIPHRDLGRLRLGGR